MPFNKAVAGKVEFDTKSSVITPLQSPSLTGPHSESSAQEQEVPDDLDWTLCDKDCGWCGHCNKGVAMGICRTTARDGLDLTLWKDDSISVPLTVSRTPGAFLVPEVLTSPNMTTF